MSDENPQTIAAVHPPEAEDVVTPETESGLQQPEPEGYQVTLPHFSGPLDLLLHLIKQHKVDIYDIPIVLITEQYNSYLDAMQELDLEVAADYIYMAALLIHIKSKMLLPRDEEAPEADDPRRELVDRLLEYQRFKAVAETFAETDLVRMGVWSRRRTPPPDEEAKELDMSDVSLFDLIDAFRSALQRYQSAHPQAIELKRSQHKVSEKMKEIIATLEERGSMRLLWYLEGRDRDELIAIFLGTLELVRLGGISLRQDEAFREIVVDRTGASVDPQEFEVFDN
jgi:segregation and condensation protein A